MEQEIVEHQQQQKQPPSTPQKCPRCGSLHTRFRYYNNNSHAQPRHYCKGCQRLWTVGGSLRPIRGRCRNGKPTRASTSGGGNPRFQPTQPWLLGNEHQQNLESPIIQPITNLPAQVSSLDAYHFNDEIPCLDMIQSLIQPEINNSHINAGDHFISAGANVTVQQEQNGQTLALQQGIMQGTTRNFGSFQTHNEATHRVDQPSWPANLTSQDVADILNFTTENTLLWNNYSCDASDTEDTTSVNVDDWLNFSDDDP